MLTGFTALAARASNQVVLVLLTLVATRYLVPAQFGVYALASIGITLVRTLFYTGPFEFLMKARDPRDCSSEVLAINVLLSVLLGAALYAIALLSGSLFHTSDITPLIILLIPSNLIAAVCAWQESLVLRSSRLKAYYILTLSGEIVAGALAALLFYLGYGIMALVAQVYARNLFLLLAYLILGHTSFSRTLSRARMAEILHWSRARYASILLNFSTMYLVDIFLGAILSPAAAGIYRASSRIVTAAANSFAQPLQLITMTIYSVRTARGDADYRDWPRVFTGIGIFGLPVLVALAATSEAIVPAVLGVEWTDAAPIVSIMCIGRAVILINSVVSTLLTIDNRQNFLLKFQSIQSIASFTMLALLTPLGALAVTLGGTVIAILGSTYLVRLTLRAWPEAKPILIQQLAPIALCSIGAAGGGLLAARIALATNASTILTLLYVGIGCLLCWGIGALLARRKVADALRALESR